MYFHSNFRYRAGVPTSRLPDNFVLMLDGTVLPALWFGHEAAIDAWNEQHPESELDYAVRDSVCVKHEPSTTVVVVYTNQPYITRKQVHVLIKYLGQVPDRYSIELDYGVRVSLFSSPSDFEEWISRYRAA